MAVSHRSIRAGESHYTPGAGARQSADAPSPPHALSCVLQDMAYIRATINDGASADFPIQPVRVFIDEVSLLRAARSLLCLLRAARSLLGLLSVGRCWACFAPGLLRAAEPLRAAGVAARCWVDARCGVAARCGVTARCGALTPPPLSCVLQDVAPLRATISDGASADLPRHTASKFNRRR